MGEMVLARGGTISVVRVKTPFSPLEWYEVRDGDRVVATFRQAEPAYALASDCIESRWAEELDRSKSLIRASRGGGGTRRERRLPGTRQSRSPRE
jgi:hypothetical protein